MRLLGKCPNCGSEDTIYQFWRETGNFDDWHKAKCSNCGTVWDNWLHLTFDEEKKGNKLIPVETEHMRAKGNGQEWGVQLVWPRRDEIPWCGMIVSTLNAALITRFSDPNPEISSWSPAANKLRVCLATEGGVEGHYKGDFIELRNIDDHLGLYVAERYPQGEGTRRVLNFYHMMLKYLFEVGPESVGGQYHRGEILRLSKDEKDFERTWEILAIMLARVKNEKFAERVVEKIKGIQRNPFSASHIKGL